MIGWRSDFPSEDDSTQRPDAHELESRLDRLIANVARLRVEMRSGFRAIHEKFDDLDRRLAADLHIFLSAISERSRSNSEEVNE